MLFNYDHTPLTGEDLAFQCVALTHAALITQEQDLKEVLLFILLEKVHALYLLLPETCHE